MRRPTPLLSAFGGDEDDDKPRALKKLSYTTEELAAAQVRGRSTPHVCGFSIRCYQPTASMHDAQFISALHGSPTMMLLHDSLVWPCVLHFVRLEIVLR